MAPQSAERTALTMAPSESYQHVVKGGLKLKGGGGLPTAGGVKKKKKKKDKEVRTCPSPSRGVTIIPPGKFTPSLTHLAPLHRRAEGTGGTFGARRGRKRGR
jgi:hypothetical protein